MHITLLLITLTLVSAAANRIVSTTPHRPALFTVEFEAEQGVLIPPMVINSTPSASGGAYLPSDTGGEGTVSFSVDLPNDGNYIIWSRVLGPDYSRDSFFVSIDGGPYYDYVAYNIWSDSWQWTKINGRADAGTPLAVDPRVFALTAGTHEIAFRSREAHTNLDRLIPTGELCFVPEDPGPAPTPTPPPPPVKGRQFYVSPQGRSEGDGSQTNPWNVWKAMSPGVVPAGSTVYFRGGTYKLDSTTEPDAVYWEVAGGEAQPTTVRNYPGERAIIDIDYQLHLYGPNVRYQGLEFITSRTKKVFASGWSPDRPGEVAIVGDNLKVINCIFHDISSTTAFSNAKNYEMYGNIMYYIGFIGQERSWGTAAYIQNIAGRKDVIDNLMFQQFNHNLQVYGSDSALVKDIYMQGNTIFNAGSLGTNRGFNTVVWVGEQPVERIKFSDNYLYSPYADSSNAVFWGAGGRLNIDLTITGNHIIGGAPAMRLGKWNPATVTNNTISSTGGLMWQEEPIPSHPRYNWNNNKYYQGDASKFSYVATHYDFNGWKQTTGLDSNSTFSPTRPTGVLINVRRNRYENGRAHITIINWDLADTASLDLSGIGLALGQSFEIRDAQNYFGPPLVAGVYNGNRVTVTLPSTGSPVSPIFGGNDPRNVGLVLPVHTSKEFNALVVQRR